MLLLLLILPVSLFADVKVTAEVDNNTAYTGQPVAGTLSVTYPGDEAIDENSFQIQEEPLQAELVHTVEISPNLKIAYYKFTLPAEEKGLHMLHAVSVSVGGKRYKSIPATYEVKTGQSPTAREAPKPPPAINKKEAPRPAPAKEAPTLELTGQIAAPTPFYPGQRARFIYEISFTQNIALSKENLPLMQAEGVSKVGEPQAETFVRQGKTVQHITQLVKAEKPGQFSYGPSSIEGQAFNTNAAGKKIFYGPVLSAQFPPINLTVSPFPEKEKPLSFNGAIGNYQLSSRLMTSPKVTVGDTMTLAVAISGEGELDTVKMPDLSCQAGWSGLFALSDLPPAVKVEGKTKTYTLDIRPLTIQLKQIPPVAFAFFDPQTGQYAVQKSEPIPITVAAPPAKEAPKVINELPEKPEAIEISGNYPLKPADLQPPLFGTPKVLWLIPIGIALLLFQFALKRNWGKKPSQPESSQLFAEAEKNSKSTSHLYQALQGAFLQRLIELGEIDTPDIQKLPASGYSKEVSQFFHNVEEMLYTPNHALSFDTLLADAKALFKRMETK